jgi:hypothetical protein
MLVVARTHQHAACGEWQHMFRLPNHSQGGRTTAQATGTHGLRSPTAQPATAEALRSSYRRTAALIHPDKCSLPHAAQAFQLLSKGYQLLQGSRGGLGGSDDGAHAAGDEGDLGPQSWVTEEEAEEGYR